MDQSCASSLPQDPNCGAPVSGREGAPAWGTGAQLECLRGDGLYPRVRCPLSLPLQPIVCPVPAVEVQSPEPRPWWPSPGQRRAQRGHSQCRIQCSPLAAVVSDGCRGQGRAWWPLGSQGCYPHGGGRRDQWWLLSLARAQYRGAGPHPVHLAVCPGVSGLGRHVACPKLSPHGVRWSVSGLGPYLVLRQSAQVPLSEAEGGTPGSP